MTMKFLILMREKKVAPFPIMREKLNCETQAGVKISLGN